MTWEFSLITSVFLICATAIVLADKYFESNKIKPVVTREEFEELQRATSVIAVEHEVIQKIAEDTKKLLSQQNIAQAFRGRREPTSI